MNLLRKLVVLIFLVAVTSARRTRYGNRQQSLSRTFSLLREQPQPQIIYVDGSNSSVIYPYSNNQQYNQFNITAALTSLQNLFQKSPPSPIVVYLNPSETTPQPQWWGYPRYPTGPTQMAPDPWTSHPTWYPTSAPTPYPTTTPAPSPTPDLLQLAINKFQGTNMNGAEVQVLYPGQTLSSDLLRRLAQNSFQVVEVNSGRQMDYEPRPRSQSRRRRRKRRDGVRRSSSSRRRRRRRRGQRRRI